MTWHLLFQAEIAVTLISCSFALLKGGAAERAGAFLILASYVADDVAFAIARPYFPTLAIFIGDFILAVCLLAVAIRYSSLWLGCAMLLQSADLCSQGLAFGGDGLGVQDQIWLNNCLSLAMIGCVVSGAVLSWRARLKIRMSNLQKHVSPPFSISAN